MRCLIVYFSQGGSTRLIAEAIAGGLRSKQHHVDLHNLKDGQPPDQAQYDVLGIGCPAQYYRPAIILGDYLDSLPELPGKPVFSFMLHAAYPGDAGNRVRRELVKKGAWEVAYAKYRGAGCFLGYLREGYHFSPDQPGPGLITRAGAFGKEIAARLGGRTYAREDYDARPAFMYRLERALTSRLLIEQFFSRLFRHDPEKCTGCGVCLKACPTGNIRDTGKGRVWGRTCILCFACEMKCPNEAISAPVTWFLFKPFMIYNTRTAAADPALGYVRVNQRNGKTTVAT